MKLKISGGWIWGIIFFVMGYLWMPHGFVWGVSAFYQNLVSANDFSGFTLYVSLMKCLEHLFKYFIDYPTSVTAATILLSSAGILYFYKLTELLFDNRFSAHLATGALAVSHLYLWQTYNPSPESVLLFAIPFFIFQNIKLRFGFSTQPPIVMILLFFLVSLMSPLSIVLLPFVLRDFVYSPAKKKIIPGIIFLLVIGYYVFEYLYNPFFKFVFPFAPSIINRIKYFLLMGLYQFPLAGWVFITIGFFYLNRHIPDVNKDIFLMIVTNIIFCFVFSPMGTFYYLVPSLIGMGLYIAAGLKWTRSYTLKSPERVLFSGLIFIIMLWFVPVIIYTVTPRSIDKITNAEELEKKLRISVCVPGRNEWLYRFDPWSHKKFTPERIYNSVKKYLPVNPVVLTNSELYFPLRAHYGKNPYAIFLLVPPEDQVRIIYFELKTHRVYLLGFHEFDFDKRGILKYFKLVSKGPFIEVEKDKTIEKYEEL